MSTSVEHTTKFKYSTSMENLKIRDHKEYSASANMMDDEESKHMAAISKLLIVLKQNRAENRGQLAAFRNNIKVQGHLQSSASHNVVTHQEYVNNTGLAYHEHITPLKEVINSDGNVVVVCNETLKVDDDLNRALIEGNAATNVIIGEKMRNCANDDYRYIDSGDDQKKRINDKNLNDKMNVSQKKLSAGSTNSSEHITLKPTLVSVKMKLLTDCYKSRKKKYQKDYHSLYKCEKLDRGHCQDDRDITSPKQTKCMKNVIDTNGSENIVRTPAADNVLKETVDKDNFAIHVTDKKKNDTYKEKITNEENRITVKSFSIKSKNDHKPAIRTNVNGQNLGKQTDNGKNQSTVDDRNFNENMHSGGQNIICCIDISDKDDDADSIYKKRLSKAQKTIGNICKTSQHNNIEKKGNEIHGASVSGSIQSKNGNYKLIKSRVTVKSDINDGLFSDYYSFISNGSDRDTVNVCASNELVPHNYKVGTGSQVYNNHDDQIQNRIGNSNTIQSKNRWKINNIMKHTDAGDEIYSNQTGGIDKIIDNKSIYYGSISSENKEINKTSNNDEVFSKQIGADCIIFNDQASAWCNNRIKKRLNDSKKSKNEKTDKHFAASSVSRTNKNSNIKIVGDDQINLSDGTIKQKKSQPNRNNETTVNNPITVNQQISPNSIGKKTTNMKEMTVTENKVGNKLRSDRKPSTSGTTTDNYIEQIQIPNNKTCTGENIQMESINNFINKKRTMTPMTDNKFSSKIRAKNETDYSKNNKIEKTDKGVATGSISKTDKKPAAKTVIGGVQTDKLGEKSKPIVDDRVTASAVQSIMNNSTEATVVGKKIDNKQKSDRKSSISCSKTNNIIDQIEVPSNEAHTGENMQIVEVNKSINKKEKTTVTDNKFSGKIRAKDGANYSKNNKNEKTDKKFDTKTIISDVQIDKLCEKSKPIFDDQTIASAIQNNSKVVTVIKNKIDSKQKSDRKSSVSYNKTNNLINQIQIPSDKLCTNENVGAVETNKSTNKKETTTAVTDNKFSGKIMAKDGKNYPKNNKNEKADKKSDTKTVISDVWTDK